MPRNAPKTSCGPEGWQELECLPAIRTEFEQTNKRTQAIPGWFDGDDAQTYPCSFIHVNAARLAWSLLLFLCLQMVVEGVEPQQSRSMSVRIIYLVSQDRTVRQDYQNALAAAATDIQRWYAKQLDGLTFRLNEPIVEVVKSDKTAQWFYSNPNGSNQDNWGYNNGLAEARRLIGTKLFDPKYVWVIYSDGPGNKGRGGNGVTVLPEDDLLGLVGQHPTQKNVKRWIAGLGHELGHAFGLAHPKDLKKDADAIMWTGMYDKYPDPTYLTEEDKQILRRSRFFFSPDGMPAASKLRFIEKYSYPGGLFGRPSGVGRTEWLELKTDGAGEIRFMETSRDKQWIQLFDDSRKMQLRLPVEGGTCAWSTDGGKIWHNLYQVVPDKGVAPDSPASTRTETK